MEEQHYEEQPTSIWPRIPPILQWLLMPVSLKVNVWLNPTNTSKENLAGKQHSVDINLVLLLHKGCVFFLENKPANAVLHKILNQLE